MHSPNNDLKSTIIKGLKWILVSLVLDMVMTVHQSINICIHNLWK